MTQAQEIKYQAQASKTKISSSRFKNQNQEPKSRVKAANEPKYCQPTLKRGQVTHQKCLEAHPTKPPT